MFCGGKFTAVICGPGRVGFSGAHTVASRSRIYPGTAASSVPHDEYSTTIFENQYDIYSCNITVTKRPHAASHAILLKSTQILSFSATFFKFSLRTQFENTINLLIYICNFCFFASSPSFPPLTPALHSHVSSLNTPGPISALKFLHSNFDTLNKNVKILPSSKFPVLPAKCGLTCPKEP